MTLLLEMSRATDEKLRAAARRLAPQLLLNQTRRGIPRRRGVARQRITPADRGGDIDLDRSMDAVVGRRAEGRAPSLEDLAASSWARPDLALCLVLDRSGSMNGSRLTAAAVATAACVIVAPEEYAVLAFASTPVVLRTMSDGIGPVRTIERVLGLRGHGTTDLDAALKEARAQLVHTRARRRVVVLLSDCRSTGVDATLTARALDDLVILAPAQDADEARRLAHDSGARIATVATVRDIPGGSLD